VLRVLFEFAMFAGSTGVFFNEEFRKNGLAVLVAGCIALASTASLFISVKDLWKDTHTEDQQPTVAAPMSLPADEIFWLSVKDSAVPGLFEEFQRKFPSSKHVAEARAKLDQLKAIQNSAAPPPLTPSRVESAKSPPKPFCVTFNNRQVCE